MGHLATASETNLLRPSQSLGYFCRPQRIWQRLMLVRQAKKLVAKKPLIFLSIIFIFILLYKCLPIKISITSPRKDLLSTLCECNTTGTSISHQHSPSRLFINSFGMLRDRPKILLFTETQHSKFGKSVQEILTANRFKYKVEVIGKSLPLLTNLSKGKYGVIVFEDFDSYLSMDQWNRELLDKYMSGYHAGLVGFMLPKTSVGSTVKLQDFPLYTTTNVHLSSVTLESSNPVLRVTKAGNVFSNNALQALNWTVFLPDHETYTPLSWGHVHANQENEGKRMFSILDNGKFDGVHRVLFGGGLQLWLNKLLFLDAISYLSYGKLAIPLERYLLVDIDDIFVGKAGTRLTPDDIKALIDHQSRLQEIIPGWRYNLGFSGHYFMKGHPIENQGDLALLENVDKFWWFGHMWRHTQPHKIGKVDKLINLMQRNKNFAIQHGIPVDSGYSVSPHHSGVYPVHEQLYDAWKKVWQIKVTSTEEYPRLRPARLRKGFKHKDIMVLPRQTCGLFTHTLLIDKYPGGKSTLDRSIQGGELFETILYNVISIFMTHQGNYGKDRLAVYTFESVIKFIRCWTNLDLKSVPAAELGELYFDVYPEEITPIWGNPCIEQRHLDIWSPNKSCSQLPQFLVIGPQKTGTTALYSFLSMHPSIFPNNPSVDTFEEVQFFTGKNYYKGIDWYMDFFPADNSTKRILFEKSATYFDGEVVPLRVKALLPSAQLVTIILPPEKRAYSWYHHMRAHNDPVAISHNFSEVLSASSKSPRALKNLKNKCLSPGLYAKHLEKWLDYFSPTKMYIIDGEELRSDPVNVMNGLQKFLGVEPFFNYSEHLRFDKQKGFYCQVVNKDKNKCLGRGKGRQYPPMDQAEEKLLKLYYDKANVSLERLLTRLGFTIPSWLSQETLEN